MVKTHEMIMIHENEQQIYEHTGSKKRTVDSWYIRDFFLNTKFDKGKSHCTERDKNRGVKWVFSKRANESKAW